MFLADEHVPRVFVTTLRSSGYTVERAQDRYGQRSIDETIVEDCRDDGLVVLTNDRVLVSERSERTRVARDLRSLEPFERACGP